MGVWDSREDLFDDDGLERIDFDGDGPAHDDPLTNRYGGPHVGDPTTEIDDHSQGLEAVNSSASAQDDLDHDDLDLDDENAQFWQKEMGFPDQLGVLRVWVNDDVLIERVRLSIHWRNRLGDQTLQQSFGVVFMLINNYHRLQRRRTLNYYDPDREASEPLSFAALDRLREREDDIRRRLDALGDEGHPTFTGTETIGAGLHGRVRLKLNLLGQLDGVQFDPAWLPGARIKEISDGVVEAHADARRHFVPAEVLVGEREKLVNELTELRNETLAMMRRGFY